MSVLGPGKMESSEFDLCINELSAEHCSLQLPNSQINLADFAFICIYFQCVANIVLLWVWYLRAINNGSLVFVNGLVQIVHLNQINHAKDRFHRSVKRSLKLYFYINNHHFNLRINTTVESALKRLLSGFRACSFCGLVKCTFKMYSLSCLSRTFLLCIHRSVNLKYSQYFPRVFNYLLDRIGQQYFYLSYIQKIITNTNGFNKCQLFVCEILYPL